MATVTATIRVADSLDDGWWSEYDQDFQRRSQFGAAGWWYADYGPTNTYARFIVSLPEDVTIASAKLIFTARYSSGDIPTLYTRIRAVAADNAAAPASYADAENATRTTAYVDWNISDPWLWDEEYESPDISTVIQEIRDRPGWAEGNAILIYWEYVGDDLDDDSYLLRPCSRDFDISYETTKCPVLSITYETSTPAYDITDSGQGIDVLAVDRDFTVSDSGVGDDIDGLLFLETDAGSGTDEELVDKQLAISDSGIGSDSLFLERWLSVTDTGSGLDTVRDLRGDFATLLQHPHKARLYLAVKKPRIIWTGTVSASRSGEDDLTITTSDGANVAGYDVADHLPDLTAWVGTGAGLHDHGKCRVRSIDGLTLTVGADMSCVWKAGDTVSITDLHELWLRPHRTEIDGDDVTFYKDTDLESTERAEYPVPVMGCDAAAFRDPDTGEATLRFDGSLSYKVQPNSDPYGGPGGLGWDNQGIASYSWWFEGGTPSTSSDPAPVVTYDAAYPNGVTVRLEVTDRDGLTFRGFRNAFIFDRTGDDAPITDIGIKRLGGSLANHGWEAELELFGESLDPDVLPEGARALLFAEEWFGDTYGSIPMGHGAITRRENVKMQGWLQDSKVVQDQSGVVSASATLRGLQRYLERAASFEVYFTQIDDVAPGWSWFNPDAPGLGDGLTVRKALYHLIQWHYTLIGLTDVLIPDDHNNYLAGHTFPGGNLAQQLDSFVKRIQAQWAADKTGALHVFSWPNWLPVSGDGAGWRTQLYQDVTFTTADFERAEIAPRLNEKVAAVRVEGIQADGSGYYAWTVDIAPGNSKGFKGSQLTVGQQIVGTGGAPGTQGYELALLRYVEESRREEKVVFPMTGNYSCFDIIPLAGYFRVTLQPARFRGFSWLAKPFWVTGLDLDVDTENGAIGATIEAFPETKPAGDFDIWSDSGEVGFEGQDDPIAFSGAFNDLLEKLDRPDAEWVPALLGDGGNNVEGDESGTSLVRLWGDPSRTVIADNRLFKNVADRPVVVEVVYNDSGAGRAGAPSYRVVAVDAAKDSDADSDADRGYITRLATFQYQGRLRAGYYLGLPLFVKGSSLATRSIHAYLGTAPVGSNAVVLLRRNGGTMHTITIPVGSTTYTASLTGITMVDGDKLEMYCQSVGSSTAGSDLTVTLECREYGL